MSYEPIDILAPHLGAPIFLQDREFIELNGKRPIARQWTTDPNARMDANRAYRRVADGGNIGVILGSNDLVVDVDPRNGGDVSWDELKAVLGMDFCQYPTVRTGSDGLHVYMRIADGLGRLKNDLTADGYPGIELKSLGRQVVAPGSIHPETRKQYRVLKDIDPLDDDLGIPFAPQSLLDIGLKPNLTRANIAPGNKSPEWLAAALEHLDPTDYRGDHEKWLELMMACHNATGGAGRDEFAVWSAGDPMYADRFEENRRRWDSLDANAKGGVTERTLFKHFNDAGVAHKITPDFEEVAADFAEYDPLDEPAFRNAVSKTKAKRQANAKKARAAKAAKAKLRKIRQAESIEAYADWVNGKFVFDRSTGKRVDIDTGEQFEDRVFEAEFGPGWARSGAKGTLLNAIKTGKAGLDLPSVMMTAAFPGQARLVPIDMGVIVDTALNTWYDTTLDPTEGNHSWFKEEIARLFPNDEQQQAILLDYWAARCIDPGRKIRWQLVIESAQGVGKGLLKSGMTTLFGWRNVGNFGVTQMLDKFNAWMVSSANLFGEEIGFGTWKDAKEAYENMKAPIADDYIAVRPMQRESMVRVPNGSNYVIHRNPGRKFYCPEDDRRICYLKPLPEDLDDKGAHFQRLAKHYGSPEDMAAVRWWLMSVWANGRLIREADGETIAGVGLVRFDSDPPMTEAKRQLMRECLRAENDDALDFRALENALDGMELFSANDVVELVRKHGLDRFDASDEQLLVAIRKWLNASGYVKHKRNTNGQGITLYSPESDSKWSDLGPAARERAYLERAD